MSESKINQYVDVLSYGQVCLPVEYMGHDSAVLARGRVQVCNIGEQLM